MSCTYPDAEEQNEEEWEGNESDISLDDDDIDSYVLKGIGIDVDGGGGTDAASGDVIFFNIVKSENRRRKLPKPRRVDANKAIVGNTFTTSVMSSRQEVVFWPSN